jgi:AMP nucleosidase
LPRYTGVPLDQFGEHILLTNFGGYLHTFARLTGAQVIGLDRPMPSATADGITMINFGMGSPNAATMMDLLSAIMPKAVLFLGKCGGLKRKNQLGDLILPIAAIRGEGTSNDYLPPEVPALPAFALQRAVSTMIRDLGHDYWTGTVYTTNRRVWEHDEAFKEYLRKTALHGDRHGDRDDLRRRLRQPHSLRRAAAGVGPADDSRRREDRGLRRRVTGEFVDSHIQVGIEALRLIRRHGKSVRHLRFDE